MSRILPTGLVAFCLAVSSARAAEELLPPFGFRWNDSMARVDAVLHGAKAKIVSREKKDNREVWTVEGLVHPGLRRTLFNFKARALLGVELQYEYPDWTIERYNQRMGEIRKYFDEKYGTGKLVSRSRDTDTDVIQSMVLARANTDFGRSISPVSSGKLKQASVASSVSPANLSSGLIKTSGMAAFGSTSSPFNFIVLGRSSTCETSRTVS